MIHLCKYVKWIPWPLKHMFRCKSDPSRRNGFIVTAFQNCHYFERQPFWKVGKNHVSHARIPWGFFLVDTGTIKDSKLLESLCLQFCLGSPYIWAILTRLEIQLLPWLTVYAPLNLFYTLKVSCKCIPAKYFSTLGPSVTIWDWNRCNENTLNRAYIPNWDILQADIRLCG